MNVSLRLRSAFTIEIQGNKRIEKGLTLFSAVIPEGYGRLHRIP